MATSRRRFLKLVTAGSAALIAGSAPAAPAAAQKKRPPATGGTKRPKAVEKEIDTQRAYVARTLQAVRGYPLPAGSELGFAFRPLTPPKKRRRSPR